MDELMNIKEAAAYLRLNYMTVYKLAQKRRLPAFKVGGNWRFKKDILDNWLTEQARANLGSVLVIEAEAAIREQLKDIINEQRYGVTTSSNAAAALDELKKQHFDLILLDAQVGGTGLTQVLESIKEKGKNAVVVLLISTTDESAAVKAMSFGPLMFIRKPFSEKDILDVLNMVMKRKS
ncbi:MAG TPA: response regulator [Dehalococcoidales bacterium]|nr:response regulator [Dehalococcoidales bacterium]